MTSTTGDDWPGPANDTSKLLAALGYIFWIVAVVALLIEPYKDQKFVKFHALQALAYSIALWIVAILASPLFGFGMIVGLIGFGYAIYLAIKSFSGEYVEVPVVSGLVKNYIGTSST